MSLAIVERQPKQQRRPGGFAGVFFQLLDWNRRFARKKLLPRKLLPPVRAAKAPAANNFVADVKMPLGKFLLVAGSIDDESQAGGFPTANKSDADLGRGMRAPGLVARMMGLDSMPVSAHERTGAATDSGCFGKKETGRDLRRLDRELRVEDGRVPRLDTRPQKLQKTGGFLARRPIDGVRAKQGAPGKKNALPSPSKINLHSSASSVKSPRLPSDRLKKAASRILEPGLKPRGRTKSAITCSDSSPLVTSGIHVITSLKECIDAIPAPGIESSMSYGSIGGTFRSELDDQESEMSNFGSAGLGLRNASCSCAGFLEDNLKSLVTQGEQIRDTKTHKHVQSKVRLQNSVKDLAEKSNTNTSKSNLDMPSTMLARNQLRRNQSTTMKGTIAFGSKVSPRKQVRTASSDLNGMKDSVSVGKISKNYIKVKSSHEKDNHQRASGSSIFDKNFTRKRTINSFTIENADAFSSIFAKQSSGCDFNREQIGHTRVRSVCGSLGSNSDNDNANEFSLRNDNIFSFTFNLNVRRASTSSSFNQMEGKSSSKNEHNNDIGTNTFLVLDEHGNTTSYKGSTLTGDELSNLLEQKIRELSSMDEDALLTRNARSVSLSPKDQETPLKYRQNGRNHFSGSSKRADTSSNIDISSLPITQTQNEAALSPEPSAVHDIDNNQLSPFSILEASFSNESSSFGSLIASSGEKLQFGLTESCNTTQSTNLDVDLSDSATSVDFTRSFTNKMQYFTDMSSRNLTNCDEVGFSNFELCDTRHLISNAALLFENFDLCPLDGSTGNSLESFLSDMLQAIADALHFDLKSDSIKANEMDQLKRLIFDCMIECLDSKFSRCWNSGCGTYCSIPFLLTQEQMMIEVYKEIQGWMDLAGKFLDDLIKNEIKSSTETWTYCKTEAYDAGIEINSQILETLVEELLIDFF